MCLLVCMGVGAVAIGMCDLNLNLDKEEEEFQLPATCLSSDVTKEKKKL